MGVSGSGTRINRSNGGKGTKSLKRQYPSSSASSQRAGSSKNLQKQENGGVPCGSKQFDLQSEKERLGYLASEQASGSSRRSHSPNKGIPDEGIGVVRRGVGPGVEEHIPNHSEEPQNRDNSTGSSGLGSNGQPMMELHNKRAFNFMGRVRNLEQVEKAISGATL